MASPFKFFRKNQAGMMAVLIILAMLVFTLDALFTASGTNFWLLGLLLGGIIFGIAGISSGQWLQWGIGGAILGVLLGLILPAFTGPPPVLAAKFGVIERSDVDDMLQRRSIANTFLYRATEEAFGAGTAQYFARFGQLPQFGFGHSDIEDVLFTRLLVQEAAELGLVVSDEMVSDFINQATGDKLSREGFIRARQTLQYQGKSVTPDTLFDIFRYEIAAQMAWRAVTPVGSLSPPPPEVQWAWFQRLHVRQSIEVAELDVDAFLDQAPEPSEAEIEELFAAARDRFPGQDEPGSPGFRLPGRARIAWLEIDFDSVASTVPPVTDEDVEAFYQENRDTPRFRKVVLPDSESPETGSEQNEPDDQTDAASSADMPAAADTTAPNTSSESGASSPEDAAAGTSEKGSTDTAPQPSDEPPGDSDTPVLTIPSEDSAPPSPQPSENPSPEGASESGSEETGGQFSLADDPSDEASDASSDQPADSPASADGTAGDAAADDPPPLVIPQLSDTDASGNSSESEEADVQYEYVELTDDLREQIREELHTQRVRDAIDAKMDEAIRFLQSIASERNRTRARIVRENPGLYSDSEAGALNLRRELAQKTDDYLQQMKAWADEHGLNFAVTPGLVTFQEFSDADDYPLGQATDPNASPFESDPGSSTAAFELFSTISDDVTSNDSSLFMPRRSVRHPAADDGTETHYAWWAVEISESHVPSLDEPGVRDSVILALKRMRARELAEARAEELAETVRQALTGEEPSGMAAVLENVTITGQDDSAALTVRQSLSFSWMRTSQTPGTSFMQRPRAELSPIRFSDGVTILEKVGHEFMKTIFEDMNDEDVAAVPNADRSAWFVVHVTNRFPTPDVGMEALMERFARDGRNGFAQSPVMQQMSSEVIGGPLVEWKRALWHKYDIDPDVVLSSLR